MLPPAQTPPWQVSPKVQALPSLQVVPSVTGLFWQPSVGLQVSVVQGLPSSQLRGGPPRHWPAEHWSPVVQAFPSSHGRETFWWTQPVAGTHESAVQTLPSSQLGGGPPTHVPPEHVSFAVQALPSLHDAWLFTCRQPSWASQRSSVHGFPSSQLMGGPPRHCPFRQKSRLVQALLSLQVRVLLFVCWQPATGSQVSVVQELPSLQLTGGPGWHAPPPQASGPVQALPSSQGAVLLLCTQPVAGSQVSVVQRFPSSQLGGGPPTHVPFAHVSAVVQTLPSVHGAVVNPVTGQTVLVPSQVPFTSQGFPSLQGVPAAAKVQFAVQQLPGAPVAGPRSHCSPGSRTPLPQIWARRPIRVLNWLVRTPPTGNPGPSTWKKFVPQALPVTVWLAAGFPIVPGGGGAGPARKVRNGPTSPLRARLNASGTMPVSRVKLMRTGGTPSARSVSTPKGCVTV